MPESSLINFKQRAARHRLPEVVASTPEQFAATVKSEIAKTAKLIKETGIRIN